MATHPTLPARGHAAVAGAASNIRKLPRTAAELQAHQASRRLSRVPPPAWLRDQLPGLLDQWSAFGAYIGWKRTAGRWTRRPCLVVVSECKHSPGRGSGIRRVPAEVTWRDGKQLHRLPTDVVQACAEFELHAGTVFGPGDRAHNQGEVATVGAAVRHPQVGRCLTTVGHLFAGAGAVGSTVQVRSGSSALNCRLVEKKQATTVDYALLLPTAAGNCDNLFNDLLRVGPVYTPGPQDLHRRVYLLGGAGQLTATQCLGIGVHFNSASGFFYNVIQTAAVSQPGNSGGALVDDFNQLWGFVLGNWGQEFSFYAPAQLILDVAGVQLVDGKDQP